MIKVAIGSTSDRKIEIVKKIFYELHTLPLEVDFSGYNVLSNVPETPYDQETFIGSQNRALNSQREAPESTFWVGLESGLVERYGHLYEEAWCTIITSNQKEYYGYSSGLKVPDLVLNKMKSENIEHNQAMPLIRQETLTPSHNRDTWSNYTGGIINREISLEEAVRNALIQISAPENSFYKRI